MEEDLAKIVGENLTALRKKKGLTQQGLAEIVNLSDKSLSKWEIGKALPHIDILKNLADFYGVTVDFLLTKDAGVNHKENSEIKSKNTNKILLVCLAVCFVFLCATVVICYYLIESNSKGVAFDLRTLVALGWALPVACLISSALTYKFWGRNIAFYILLSLFTWTLITAVCTHLQVYFDQPTWFMYIVGIPVQLGIYLFSRLR